MKMIEQSRHLKHAGINSSDGRIFGFDFARAIAILSMISVNFKVVMEVDRTPAPAGWFRCSNCSKDRRPPPLLF